MTTQEMKEALKAKGINVPTNASAAAVKKLFEENAEIIEDAEETNDYELETKVINVIDAFSEKHNFADSARRVVFNCDQEFSTVDSQTPEATTANRFSINVFNLVNQVSAIDNTFAMIASLAMGKELNHKLIALMFAGATITIKRTFKAQGATREDGKGTYANDTYTTKITSVKFATNPMQNPLVMQIAMNAPTQPQPTMSAANMMSMPI